VEAIMIFSEEGFLLQDVPGEAEENRQELQSG
jgi:hypothetical protein